MTNEKIFEAVIAKVKADEELTKKFMLAFNEGNLAAVVKEMGYDFPVDEFIAYIDANEENLDVSELNAVAGGANMYEQQNEDDFANGTPDNCRRKYDACRKKYDL